MPLVSKKKKGWSLSTVLYGVFALVLVVGGASVFALGQITSTDNRSQASEGNGSTWTCRTDYWQSQDCSTGWSSGPTFVRATSEATGCIRSGSGSKKTYCTQSNWWATDGGTGSCRPTTNPNFCQDNRNPRQISNQCRCIAVSGGGFNSNGSPIPTHYDWNCNTVNAQACPVGTNTGGGGSGSGGSGGSASTANCGKPGCHGQPAGFCGNGLSCLQNVCWHNEICGSGGGGNSGGGQGGGGSAPEMTIPSGADAKSSSVFGQKAGPNTYKVRQFHVANNMLYAGDSVALTIDQLIQHNFRLSVGHITGWPTLTFDQGIASLSVANLASGAMPTSGTFTSFDMVYLKFNPSGDSLVAQSAVVNGTIYSRKSGQRVDGSFTGWSAWVSAGRGSLNTSYGAITGFSFNPLFAVNPGSGKIQQFIVANGALYSRIGTPTTPGATTYSWTVWGSHNLPGGIPGTGTLENFKMTYNAVPGGAQAIYLVDRGNERWRGSGNANGTNITWARYR